VIRPISGARGLLFEEGSGNFPQPVDKPQTLGLVLADAALRPVLANHEAVTILTYPRLSQSLAAVFDKKFRRSLLRAQGSRSKTDWAPPVIQCKSGRRTYFCRAFLLNEGQASKDAMTLIVLERGMSASLALSQVSQKFRLTQREQETVALLLQGLSNREMADRMRVSPNTVRAFLRLVMIKMAVAGRSAIIVKVLRMVLSSPYLGAGLAPHRDNGKFTRE
jgi:DNA-binding CsgD family transcriptional regulator